MLPDHSAPMAQLRNTIYDAISKYDLTTAVEKYRELITQEPNQVLPQKEQLEIANHSMSMKDFMLATEAYEKFLKYFADSPQAQQVELLLGIIYSRYLNNHARAEELLQKAKQHLKDPNQITLCEEELKRLNQGV